MNSPIRTIALLHPKWHENGDKAASYAAPRAMTNPSAPINSRPQYSSTIIVSNVGFDGRNRRQVDVSLPVPKAWNEPGTDGFDDKKHARTARYTSREKNIEKQIF